MTQPTNGHGGVPVAAIRARSRPAPAPFLEQRRFRTWESDTHAVPTQRWKVVLRYGLIRTARTWYLAGLLSVAVLLTAITLVSFSYSILDHTSVDDYGAATAIFLTVPAIILLLVGAPLLSEDVRFNAPLFYFSRPLRTVDYLLGKCAQLYGLVVATGLAPMVLFALLVVLLGVHPVEATDGYGNLRSASEMSSLRAHRVDSYGEAFAAGMATILGMASVLFFATSAMVACSAYTRRAWHAAMAFVAVLGSWSLLGVFMTELVKGAFENLFGPGGWAYLVLGMPLDLMFRRPGPLPPSLEGAPVAVVLAHLILVGLGIVCLRLAQRRLRHLEALL